MKSTSAVGNNAGKAVLIGVLALAAGCYGGPAVKSAPAEPDTLVVHPDGTMLLNDRPIPEDDVVIYKDGRGGERAAVRVRMEPLHPDFFRDTIIVERKLPSPLMD